MPPFILLFTYMGYIVYKWGEDAKAKPSIRAEREARSPGASRGEAEASSAPGAQAESRAPRAAGPDFLAEREARSWSGSLASQWGRRPSAH